MMKNEINLGETPPEDAERDAVHVAVIAVRAKEALAPGERVAVFGGEGYKAKGEDFTGIVDPFGELAVQPGERFWLLLRPGTIVSLRHEWSHPSFPSERSDRRVNASMEWLAEHSRLFGYDLGELIDSARKDPMYLFFQGCDSPDDLEDDFWQHLARVVGREWSSADRQLVTFGCAC